MVVIFNKLLKILFFQNNSSVNIIDESKLGKIIYNKKWIIIDLRPSAEFKTSHILLSTNLNIIKFKKRYHKYINKNQKILLVCRHGKQSPTLAKYLLNKGYNVSILKYGFQNPKLLESKWIIK